MRLARSKKQTKTIIVRVRRYSGFTGGQNYYHHADVICHSKKEALEAAKEGRVKNWRLIDKFDTTDRDYEYYEVLYLVTEEEAKRPHTPSRKKPK